MEKVMKSLTGTVRADQACEKSGTEASALAAGWTATHLEAGPSAENWCQ